MAKLLRCSAILAIVLFLSGCAVPRPPRHLPSDSGNPLKRVAVLPLKNDTTDVDGSVLVRKKMVEALESRSYVVKDLKETDQILRDRMGITLGGQLSLTTASQLGEALGVEGVLYGTLMDFDETTLGAINVKKVRAKFKLVNAMSGQSHWERGLGVRSEMKMSGNYGTAATLLSRAVDARDKEVPWVTIETTSTGSKSLGESFAMGIGTRLLSTAAGTHLDYESSELTRRVTDNLPWGPGMSAPESLPAPRISLPDIKMPAPPSFGYMDWKGERDFTAVVYSTTIDKNRREPFTMEISLAIAGNRLRMDMDMSRMFKGDAKSPLGKMVVIDRGDKKTGYTLYPNAQRYMVHTEKEEFEERPKVEKALIGRELVGKYPADKFRVRIIHKDGKIEQGFIWNARELGGMTIRSEIESPDYKVTTDLRNIVLKTPQASLFEIPSGYTEAQGLMDLMTADPKRN